MYRNGNCTIIGTSDAAEEIYIPVDLDHLRESNLNDTEIYCHETINCGTNYVSLREVLKKSLLLGYFCWSPWAEIERSEVIVYALNLHRIKIADSYDNMQLNFESVLIWFVRVIKLRITSWQHWFGVR